MKTIHIVLGIAIILLVGALVWPRNSDPVIPPAEQTASIKGCYVATIARDVYTLSILSQEGEAVSGTLRFKNFEKDSSSGSFIGTYRDGILFGEYSFQSEGMDSVMEVIFKRQGDDFIRGYGDLTAGGTTFANLDAISYDSSVVFRATADCSTAAVPSAKLAPGSASVVPASAIQSKAWVWQRTVMNDGAVIIPKKTSAFTLTLGADGRATGTTDCNSYFASYKIGSDGVIDIGAVGATKMFCEGSQESVFTNHLAQANHYMVDSSGNLVLLLPYDSGSMMFTR